MGSDPMAVYGEVQSPNLPSREEGCDLLLPGPKKDRSVLLRRAISEMSELETGDMIVVEELQQLQQASEINSELAPPQMIDCECCGMSEECTPTYIARIKEFHCGKWVCGLCSEAVKEKKKKKPVEYSMREALESHMALCLKFNRTIRTNPKLSLASSMRDIARRSSQRRTSSKDLFASSSSTIARTSSCGARITPIKVKEYSPPR